MFQPALIQYYLSIQDDVNKLARIFPELYALHQTQIFPLEICSQIIEFVGPSCRIDVDTATNNHCNTLLVDSERCRSPGCNWDCITCVRSRQPFYPLRFFEIDCVEQRGSGPLQQQVGIGYTEDPNFNGGGRRNNKNGIVYVDAKDFYHGIDETTGNEQITNLSNQINSLSRMNRHMSISDIRRLAFAVDYNNNQLLLKYPGRRGIVRFDLPDHNRGHLLFPFVQIWNGCVVSFRN